MYKKHHAKAKILVHTERIDIENHDSLIVQYILFTRRAP